MIRWGIYALLGAVGATSASAQATAPPAAEPNIVAAPTTAITGGRIPARTPVELRIVETVGSRISRPGEMFAIELSHPVVGPDGRVLLAAGVRGVGEVVHTSRGGGAGKAGELVLAARKLTCGAVDIPLGWFEIPNTAVTPTNDSIALPVIGNLARMFVKGGEVVVASGTRAAAQTRMAVEVASDCGEPSRPMVIPTRSGFIDPPPAGKGKVVFFRPFAMNWAALGCTVRNTGGEVARLGSGKYFAVTVEPGKQNYFTTGEATDRLTIEVDPDATYFVRCNIGMGVVAGRANLSPSDRATFEARAGKLNAWVPKTK